MLQPTLEALAKYLKDHSVPAHRYGPVSTTEIARPRSLRSGGAGPHERPWRAAVAGGAQGDGGRSRLIGWVRWEARAEGPPAGQSCSVLRGVMTICGRW